MQMEMYLLNGIKMNTTTKTVKSIQIYKKFDVPLNESIMYVFIELILADGTFTYGPKHFYQLYTIHVPHLALVFCFLPLISTEMYKKKNVEALKDLCLNYANE
ncbi:MULE domain-containing protein, partial [Aphis craccivora]